MAKITIGVRIALEGAEEFERQIERLKGKMKEVKQVAAHAEFGKYCPVYSPAFQLVNGLKGEVRTERIDAAYKEAKIRKIALTLLQQCKDENFCLGDVRYILEKIESIQAGLVSLKEGMADFVCSNCRRCEKNPPTPRAPLRD